MKIIYVILALTLSSLAHADVVIIVNQGNNNTLDKASISQLFLGKSSSFSNGSEAIPITQEAGGATTKEFNRKALKKSENQLRAYWSKLIFTGKGTPPKAVKSDDEVIELVSKNPNLIGYVSTAADVSGVKVVEKF
jgi:ABC-type phosphate transport system substrate-binding protein